MRISGTAGTIGGNTNTGISGVSSSAVFNGKLYVGTSESNAAEVYRYDGGSTWTLVSHTTPGTITSGAATTGIDGVTAMIVYNGHLYIGTNESKTAIVVTVSTTV